ncbi:MAG TPA: VanZ family protein [Pyrinomonadaceae bacterium]|jgi:VanZ family protein|nr:VanZ family protein [Pyrinomonadaceae bacterium]
MSATRSEIDGRACGDGDEALAASSSWRSRLWRYAPLVGWIAFIFFASTGAMSASNTSRIIAPLFRWLFPAITEAQLLLVHFTVRKTAHFTEYAILALLAARAFIPSTRPSLHRHPFVAALALVAAVALLDEFNQSFNAARTGTIWDSLLDVAGGATALVALGLWRARRQQRRRRGRLK